MMKAMGFQAAHIAIGPRCVEEGVANGGLFDGFAGSDIKRVRRTGSGLMVGHDGGHPSQLFVLSESQPNFVG